MYHNWHITRVGLDSIQINPILAARTQRIGSKCQLSVCLWRCALWQTRNYFSGAMGVLPSLATYLLTASLKADEQAWRFVSQNGATYLRNQQAQQIWRTVTPSHVSSIQDNQPGDNNFLYRNLLPQNAFCVSHRGHHNYIPRLSI